MLLLLLSVGARQAHAGHWELDRYEVTGDYQSEDKRYESPRYHDGLTYEDLFYYDDGSQLHSVPLKAHPQNPRPKVWPVYQGSGSVSTDTRLSNYEQVGYGGFGGPYHYTPSKLINTNSVHAIFKWHRDSVGYNSVTGQYIDDPNDNPPDKLYIWESGQIWISRYHGGSRYGFSHPFHGEGISIQMSSTVPNTSKDDGGHTPDVNESYEYTEYDNNISGTNVIALKTGGTDEVSGPTRTLSAQVDTEDQTFQSDTEEMRAWASCRYEAQVLSIGIGATPVGPYDTVKDQPNDKELNGIARWTNKMTDDDGTFNVMHVEPIITANSYFSAWAKMADGSDLFPNQKYIWEVDPATYIPVSPPMDSVNSILYKWTMDGAIQETQMLRSPIPDPLHINPVDFAGHLNDGLHLINPSFRDAFIDQWRLTQAAANPPAEQKVDTSTSTKDLSWEFGTDYKNFGTKTSTVRAFVTGQNDGDPVIPLGKVKLNWSRPKKCVFRVTISGTTWHIPQGEGFVDVVKRSFNADGGLTAQVEGWAGLQIANVALMAVPGGGEAGAAAEAATIEITTTSEVSAEAIADQVAANVQKTAVDVVADDVTIPRGAQSETKIEVTPQAEPGEAPEPPVTRVIPKGRGDWPVQRPTGDEVIDKIVREVDDVNPAGTLDPVNCGACTAAALMREFGVDVNAVAKTFDEFPNGMSPAELQDVMMKRGIEMTDEVECKTVADLQAQLGQLQPNQKYAIAEYAVDGKQAHWYNATSGENGTILYDTQKGAGEITPNADSNFWVYVFER